MLRQKKNQNADETSHVCQPGLQMVTAGAWEPFFNGVKVKNQILSSANWWYNIQYGMVWYTRV